MSNADFPWRFSQTESLTLLVAIVSIILPPSSSTAFNNITTLPSGSEAMTNLKELWLCECADDGSNRLWCWDSHYFLIIHWVPWLYFLLVFKFFLRFIFVDCDADNNRFTSLPIEIGKMTNLRELGMREWFYDRSKRFCIVRWTLWQNRLLILICSATLLLLITAQMIIV